MNQDFLNHWYLRKGENLFSLEIPSPRTRKKAEEVPAYADYTIGAKGLWNVRARSRW